MKKILIIILLVLGCDDPPTEHTHIEDRGRCVIRWNETMRNEWITCQMESNQWYGRWHYYDDLTEEICYMKESPKVEQYDFEEISIFSDQYTVLHSIGPYYVSSWTTDQTCEDFCSNKEENHDDDVCNGECWENNERIYSSYGDGLVYIP